MSVPRIDYDNPWKEVLEGYFPAFMELFFPQVHAEIDWSKSYEFLDKELQQVVRDAELGTRRTDKLIKVWRTDGEDLWVLIHIEVQVQEEKEFAKRMYVYNYRLFDRYDRKVASLAVLGDESPKWRPERFGYALWGCTVGFEFPVAKLLDWREQWDDLEASANPFATVVMAHLKAQETRRDDEVRKHWKFVLVRRMYERGYSRNDILELFRFIDWVMALPEELGDELWQEIQELERVMQMPYITSVERIGIQKGIEQGREQGREQGLQQGMLEEAREMVLRAIHVRYKLVPTDIEAQVQRIDTRATLASLLEHAIMRETLDEFREALRMATGNQQE